MSIDPSKPVRVLPAIKNPASSVPAMLRMSIRHFVRFLFGAKLDANVVVNANVDTGEVISIEITFV